MEVNDETQAVTTLKDIQCAALDILLDFVRVCDSLKLTYYISGGTYLGAIRHNGFIPWDDDVDVAMPRKDYDKLLLCGDNFFCKDYKLVHYSKQDNVIHYCAKLESSKYQLIDNTASVPRKVNIWIDIFPLDGMPDNAIVTKLHELRLLSLRGLFKLSLFDKIVNQKNRNRPVYENVIIDIARHVNFSRFMNPNKRMQALDKTLSKYDFYSSKKIMNFMGSYKFKSIMDRKNIYSDGAFYSFEGHKLRGPKNYDAYLRKIYGDYMKLPPLEERNWHQTSIVDETSCGLGGGGRNLFPFSRFGCIFSSYTSLCVSRLTGVRGSL